MIRVGEPTLTYASEEARADWFAHPWRWHLKWDIVRVKFFSYFETGYEDIVYRDHPLAGLVRK